ncbi:enoyl-CoA hydratase/isomerase family protein [Fervidibacillus halotolerans]|uniref:Enoyl-CoA hydratase-related protein n=1 Tax=Fervidibacillus halotolerans TaxID=2980027 RepID=A0A9E8RWK2_9BACI|nr:enoyl-CoA hydratase-related protein [Fervidibacillus halotolerans]WAA11850.1 enoyl-CoA hydratase-related protein [Fervidibacillus halotolerans]
MENELSIEKKKIGPIALITLNRPSVLNALNREMVNEIITSLKQFDQNDEVRVIVINGKGKAFAAGADIEEMASDHPISLEWLNPFAEWDQIYSVKKPIIGAVHGYCLGGGFELALACDLLIAAERTKFGFPEVKLGVMPGAGGTQWLPKFIGKTKAMEWLFTGDLYDASEVYLYGIINKIVPNELLMEETMKLAEKIANQPPLSIRLIKEAVYKAIDEPLREGMHFERKNFYLLFASEDQKEGMQAFLEKRNPQFKGK